MELRNLGKTGPPVGVIGLGTEHLEPGRETLNAVLSAMVEVGGNYVDLLYIEDDYWGTYGPVYRGYRDHLVLAVHWGSGPQSDLGYCRRSFANVISRVGNDYVDVAMMTMIDDGERLSAQWRDASLAHLRQLQEQGHVGLIGGSAHDPLAASQAVREGLVDVLMFPINMIYHDAPQEHALIETCAEHGVGLVAMKPYHGSTLFSVNGRPTGIRPAQCLHYVFSLPVAAAVPGPKTLTEWRSTLSYLPATDEERAFNEVLGTLRDRLAGQCVYCHHCLPCPEGIEIGWLIWHVDQARSGDIEQIREWYSGYTVGASACIECGACLQRCPFDVNIYAKLREAVELFETTAPAGS